MYAVGFVNFGNLGMVHPMGNQGLQKIHGRTYRTWDTELQTMKKNVDEIYVMYNFTQEMCEMDNDRLYKYCRKRYAVRVK